MGALGQGEKPVDTNLVTDTLVGAHDRGDVVACVEVGARRKPVDRPFTGAGSTVQQEPLLCGRWLGCRFWGCSTSH